MTGRSSSRRKTGEHPNPFRWSALIRHDPVVVLVRVEPGPRFSVPFIDGRPVKSALASAVQNRPGYTFLRVGQVGEFFLRRITAFPLRTRYDLSRP